LAMACAEEWEAQGVKLDPLTMPFTGLSNAALDRVTNDRAAIAATIAAYGESDMLCFRGEVDEPLTARQAEQWDPLLAWARGRFDVSFTIVHGIIHKAQPDETVARLGAAVSTYGAFEMAAMSKLVSLSGSLVATLAMMENADCASDLWPVINLEELWQVELWGEDHFAKEARDLKHAEFGVLLDYLAMLRA